MTNKEKYRDKPFAMMNWHKNFCEKKHGANFCERPWSEYDSSADWYYTTHYRWNDCKNRDICFAAWLESEAIEDGNK